MNFKLQDFQKLNRSILVGSVAGLANKILMTLSTLIAVPLCYQSLPQDEFVAWMTIISIYPMLQFLDLGLGNGLINIISESYAKDDHETTKQAVSTYFFICSSISFLVIALSIGFFQFEYLSYFYKSDYISFTSINLSIIAMLIIFALNLPPQVVSRLLVARQESSRSNAISSAGIVISLLFVYISFLLGATLPIFILAQLSGPFLSNIFSFILEFKYKSPQLSPNVKYISIDSSLVYLKQGFVWTLFQIIALISTGFDNIIVAYHFGSSAAEEFSLVLKLQTALLFSQFISMPLWPALNYAITRGDYPWARRVFIVSLAIFGAIGIFSSLVIIFMGEAIISIWVGKDYFKYPNLIYGFACWSFITNIYASIATALSGDRFLKKLTVLSFLAVSISFFSKVLISPLFDPAFVIWSTCIGFGLVCLPGIFMVFHYFSQGRDLHCSP